MKKLKSIHSSMKKDSNLVKESCVSKNENNNIVKKQEPSVSMTIPEDVGFYEDDKGKLHLNGHRYAMFWEDRHRFIYIEGLGFLFYRRGEYKAISDLQLDSMMREWLVKHFGTEYWSIEFSKEYMANLKTVLLYDALLNPSKKCINLQNGMFDISNYKLKKHNYQYYSTVQLPLKYDPEAKCLQFNKFMDDICLDNQDLIKVIQEIVGYCLTPYMNAQCFFIFYGLGANGKSVLMNIIKKLVGEGNYTTLNIHQLGERFSKAALYGKNLNIAAENESTKKYNSETIKAITGEDEIKAEYKGKDVFVFKSTCKLIFAANTLPVFSDNSLGFYRRIKIIPFNATFSQKDGTADVHLEEKLCAELPGIFNWAIEGLRRLKDNDFKFTTAECMLEMHNEYKKSTDIYLDFFSECIVYDSEPPTKIPRKKVFEAFRSWGYEKNIRQCSNISERMFWPNIARVIANKSLPPMVVKKTNNIRCIVGMGLKANEHRMRNGVIKSYLDDELEAK